MAGASQQNRTSQAHTLRSWKFEVVDCDIYALPHKELGERLGHKFAGRQRVEQSLDNVILAFCGHCGNGTLILNPDEWFASRKRVAKRGSNRMYLGRSCPYCFATCELPDKAEFDKLVQEGKTP